MASVCYSKRSLLSRERMCYKQEREPLLKKRVLRDEEFCEIKSVCGLLCLLQKSVRLVNL